MSHRAGDGEAVGEGLSLVMSGVLPAKALEKKKKSNTTFGMTMIIKTR